MAKPNKIEQHRHVVMLMLCVATYMVTIGMLFMSPSGIMPSMVLIVTSYVMCQDLYGTNTSYASYTKVIWCHVSRSLRYRHLICHLLQLMTLCPTSNGSLV